MRRGAWCWPTRWRWPRAASRALMLDFATLTGACVYALTERMSGLLANNDDAGRRRTCRGHAQRRTTVALPAARGLRHRHREPGGRCGAVLRGRQGRPHPGRAIPAALRTQGHALGACGSVFVHATRRTGACAHRNHRFRRALCAGIAAGRQAAAMSDTLRMRQPDDWHLHLRDGAALAAVLPHTAAQFARAIVMPNLQAAGDHHRNGARLSRTHPCRAARRQRLPAADDAVPHRPHRTGRDPHRDATAASSTAASCIRRAPPPIPMPASPTSAASTRCWKPWPTRACPCWCTAR